jgi:preprotein translocase subunit SecB
MLEPIDFTGIYLQQRSAAGDVAQGEIRAAAGAA